MTTKPITNVRLVEKDGKITLVRTHRYTAGQSRRVMEAKAERKAKAWKEMSK